MHSLSHTATSKHILVLLVIGALLASLSGCATPRPPQTEPPAPDRIRQDLIRGEFRVEGSVVAGKPFDLTFSIHPLVDMPGTTITLLLPEGVQVTAGSTTWQGDVAAKERVEQKVTLVLPGDGEWDIRAAVKSPGGADLNRVYHAFLDPGSAEGLKKQPKAREHPQKEKPRRLPEQQALASQSRSLEDGLSLPATTTITGRLGYETDDGYVYPVRLSVAQLWEITSSGQYTLLATGTTDAAGYFSFGPSISASKNVVVDVFCQTAAAVAKSADGYTYSAELGPQVIYPGVSNDLGSWYTPYYYDEWEASDDILDAYQWVNANGNGWARSRVTIAWPCSCWPSSDGDTIYLPEQTSTWWDRMAPLHEYGHAIQHAAYGYMVSPCYDSSGHYVNSETCEETALWEGFAEFFEAAVDNNPDNMLDYTCGYWMNIENNNWELGRDCVANNSGAIVEGAVASTWWDILDANNYANGDLDRDTLSLGFDEIWNVLRTYKPQGINAFWTAWLNAGYGYKPQMNLIFYDHGVDKDTPPSAPAGPSPAIGALVPSASAASLHWSASDAEGDALCYDIYFGTTTNPPLISGNQATTTFTFGSPLAAGTYYWAVVAKDAVGKQTVGPLWQFMVCDGSITLSQGWNLVSLPLVPSSTDPATILAPIDGRYDAVFAYDAADTADHWKQYMPSASGSNDLTSIDPSMGIWIHTTGTAQLCLAGVAPVTSTITLKEGWNLVGYPSPTARPVTEALASIDGKYELVYAYDVADTSDPWAKLNVEAPPPLNDLATMAPGKGYWIHATQDCEWSVP